MSAGSHLPAESDARAYLVRLGQLDFDDFRLLPAADVRRVVEDEAARPDLNLALNNTPHVLLHFQRSANLPSARCRLQTEAVPTLDQVCAAQSRLVLRYAGELLREKAPPLYDILPWHDWDFAIVADRFRLWQTRFLLAGEGTTVVISRCRKTAGVYVVEPNATLACYLEKKAALEKVKRFRLLSCSLPLSLPPASVDLAIIGSTPQLPITDWQLFIRQMLRISRVVLLVENSPLVPPLPGPVLLDSGFKPNTVQVTSLGPRRCWWHLAP